MEASDCKAPFCSFTATTAPALATHVCMCNNYLIPIVTLLGVPEHIEKRIYTSVKQKTLYATRGCYRGRFLSTNLIRKMKQNLDFYAHQIAQTEEVKPGKQLHMTKGFTSTRALQEYQKHDKEAPQSKLQRVSSIVLNRILSSSTVLSSATN